MMGVNPEQSALIATFADRRQAQHYLDELRRAGFQEGEVGVLTPHPDDTPVENHALAGAITGGMVGAVTGLVATGLIPGIGPVLATGLLAGMFGGAAVGATAGGMLGTLIGLGIPEDQARRYEQEFLAGRTLVAVQAAGRGGEALAILRRCQAHAVPGEPAGVGR
jgi:Heat induced stress protein YflT